MNIGTRIIFLMVIFCCTASHASSCWLNPRKMTSVSSLSVEKQKYYEQYYENVVRQLRTDNALNVINNVRFQPYGHLTFNRANANSFNVSVWLHLPEVWLRGSQCEVDYASAEYLNRYALEVTLNSPDALASLSSNAGESGLIQFQLNDEEHTEFIRTGVLKSKARTNVVAKLFAKDGTSALRPMTVKEYLDDWQVKLGEGVPGFSAADVKKYMSTFTNEQLASAVFIDIEQQQLMLWSVSPQLSENGLAVYVLRPELISQKSSDNALLLSASYYAPPGSEEELVTQGLQKWLEQIDLREYFKQETK